MQVVRTIKEYREIRKFAFGLGAKVGFVPTMGALHAGHLSLIQKARKDCDAVVCSIFVNPLQFGPNEDFNKYPRVEDQDIKLLEEGGVSVVFAPSVSEMYPSKPITSVHLTPLDATEEGVARPGHFTGVATVVSKLFNIVTPEVAYFGQKDAIQCLAIQNMVADLNFPVEIEIVPTMREEDGLAMSSRNRYLTKEDRALAPLFYKALKAAEEVARGPNPTREKILQAAKAVLQHPGITIGYLSIASLRDGTELTEIQAPGFLLSGAIKIGQTRLIDNLIVQL